MKKTIALAVAGIAATVMGLTACGGTGAAAQKPSVSACKTAVTEAFDFAVANPSAAPLQEPAACKGLTPDQLTTIAAQVMGNYLNGGGN